MTIDGRPAPTSICDRDVGLSALVQTVIEHIPWAQSEGRIPVACFGDRCCSYWTPNGHRGKDTVCDYYFEPLVASHPPLAPGRSTLEQLRRCDKALANRECGGV